MMAAPVRLRITLGSNNAEKLTIETAMPKSVEDLSNEIKRQFDLDGDIRLQSRDTDFGNEFVNLNQIRDIQDKSTGKVIRLSDAPGNMKKKDETSILLSSPDSAAARSQWPTECQIPTFPCDVEMQLESANQDLISSGVLLNPSHNLKSDILESLAEQIIKLKA